MMAVFAAPAWAQSLSINENVSPNRVKVGQVFTYTVNVTNTGPATAPGVRVVTIVLHSQETLYRLVALRVRVLLTTMEVLAPA